MSEIIGFGLIGYCTIGCIMGIISVLKNEELIKISNNKKHQIVEVFTVFWLILLVLFFVDKLKERKYNEKI